MHRNLKAAYAKPSPYDLKAQQSQLNNFVKEYNHIRPHEALDMETPAFSHDFSNRPYPEKYPILIIIHTLKYLRLPKMVQLD
jgi:hypothetical protein